VPTNIKRKSRFSKGSINILNKWQKEVLLHGDFDGMSGWAPDTGSAFESLEDSRDAWNLHKKELLPEFIKAHPGHRPQGWWEFSFPQLKLKLVGEYSWWCSDQVYLIEPEFETSFECLERNGHLVEGETISKFDAEEIEKRKNRITGHQKRLKEYPPEKFKESDRVIQARKKEPKKDCFWYRDQSKDTLRTTRRIW
jgi:hypothetical protein